MNDELKHYRTLGSKNGVRLYQNKDGTLTRLGKLRYLNSEKTGNKNYYEQGYKTSIFDYYGQTKKKEYDKYRKDVGVKTVKGYEKAEAHELKREDPKGWHTHFTVHQLSEKPAAKRARHEQWKKDDEILKEISERERRETEAFNNSILGKTINASDNLTNKVLNTTIDKKFIDAVGKYSGVGVGPSGLIYGVVEYLVNKNKNNKKENTNESSETNNYKDTKASNAEAYAGILRRKLARFFSKYEKQLIHSDDKYCGALDLVDEDIYENDELKHWGIIGMKWGIRRFQNPDGSLTPEGRERYGVKTAAETKKLSYSQKYEVLKNKKDRTEEEEKEYQKLKAGREWYIDTYIPAVMNHKMIEINSPEDSIKYNQGLEYFLSTNYGKKASELSFLTGSIQGSRDLLQKDDDFYIEILRDAVINGEGQFADMKKHLDDEIKYVNDQWKRYDAISKTAKIVMDKNGDTYYVDPKNPDEWYHDDAEYVNAVLGNEYREKYQNKGKFYA